MPFCPECGAEFQPHVRRCSDCGIDLVDSPPQAVDSGHAQSKLVEVYRASGELEAQIIRGLLESAGIDCSFRGEAVRLTHSIAVNGLAEVRILVRAEDAERAERLIASSDLKPTT
jgi:hypothetical protein